MGEDVYLEDGNLVLWTRLDGFDPTASRPENCSELMYDTDVDGPGPTTTSAADVGECCQQCRENPTCGYFSYLEGGWGCEGGCCYQKNAEIKGFISNKTGVISGHVPGAGTY